MFWVYVMGAWVTASAPISIGIGMAIRAASGH